MPVQDRGKKKPDKPYWEYDDSGIDFPPNTPGGGGNNGEGPLNRQFIRISAKIFENPIDVLLAGEVPKPTGGIGGFEDVTRPRQVAASRWSGQSRMRMTVPLMIDDFLRQGDVEPQRVVDKILKLGRDLKEDRPPPAFRMFGKALPFSGWTWVLEDWDWGATLRSSDGTLRRQEMVLTVSEFVPVDAIKFKRRKKKGKNGKARHYTIKKGDTLFSIAKKFYGDRSKWKRIAERNDLKGPRNLKVGKRIVIP